MHKHVSRVLRLTSRVDSQTFDELILLNIPAISVVLASKTPEVITHIRTRE